MSETYLELEEPFDLKELLPKGSTVLDDFDLRVRFRDRSNLLIDGVFT